ncbi:hypothetical protein VTH06DRAFT_738 [Thermothelomyces fergusii]
MSSSSRQALSTGKRRSDRVEKLAAGLAVDASVPDVPVACHRRKWKEMRVSSGPLSRRWAGVFGFLLAPVARLYREEFEMQIGGRKPAERCSKALCLAYASKSFELKLPGGFVESCLVANLATKDHARMLGDVGFTGELSRSDTAECP